MSVPFHNGLQLVPFGSSGAPSSGTWATGTIICDSVGALYQCTTGGTPGTWSQVGSGSSVTPGTTLINYCTNPDAEIGTSGWATYADAAATQPADGTGGAANITWARDAANFLRGAASFVFGKTAVNRQGEGVGYAFSIPNGDKGRQIEIEFEYAILAGTCAASDIVVGIYDVTNAAIIAVGGGVGTLTNSGGLEAAAAVAKRARFSFQAAATSASYRLILHVSSVSAVAYTVMFDDFRIYPASDQMRGRILQTFQTVDFTARSSTSVGGIDTGLTPLALPFRFRSLNSKIRIAVNLGVGCSIANGIGLYLARSVNGAAYAGWYASAGIDWAWTYVESTSHFQQLALIAEDTPTAFNIAYKIFYEAIAAATMYINRRGLDATVRSCATCEIQEIAG